MPLLASPGITGPVLAHASSVFGESGLYCEGKAQVIPPGGVIEFPDAASPSVARQAVNDTGMRRRLTDA